MKLKKITQEAANSALKWDLSEVTQRLMSDENISEERALILERELKRFLIVSADNIDVVIGMAGPVDKIWHTFLLFTAEYSKFCHELCGHIIHHSPRRENEATIKDPRQNPYLRFLALYENTFGEAPSSEVWPRASISSGGDCIIFDCMEDCLFRKCEDCYRGPPENCKNRPPVPESECGTDPEPDTDSDEDPDKDTDSLLGK